MSQLLEPIDGVSEFSFKTFDHMDQLAYELYLDGVEYTGYAEDINGPRDELLLNIEIRFGETLTEKLSKRYPQVTVDQIMKLVKESLI